MQTTGEVNAASNVAPLIGTADLQATIILSVELGKIVRLENHVGEFGETDTRALALDSLFHGLFLDHRVDREMLANVAKESQYIHTLSPVEVIHY